MYSCITANIIYVRSTHNTEETLDVVQWLRLDAGLSMRTIGFDPRPVHVWQRGRFLSAYNTPPLSIIPQVFHTRNSCIYHRHYITSERKKAYLKHLSVSVFK